MDRLMNRFHLQDALNRRVFLGGAAGTLAAAVAGLTPQASAVAALPGIPHHAPKAKRIIYLFQSGAPSQMDLFDPKPALAARRSGCPGVAAVDLAPL